VAKTFDKTLKKLLKDADCHFVRHGKHPIWYSPVSERHVSVPTRIKSRHTANQVLKDCGLPKKF
jgi:hypothetical protein